MIKNIALTMFLGAVAFLTLESNVHAQIRQLGSPLGQLPIAVLRTGGGISNPDPPYFAVHPPVYYNRVVSRAYGISPFAAPAGVMPVENSIAGPPKTVLNPFFKPNPKSVLKTTESDSQKIRGSKIAPNQLSRIINPFFSQPKINVRNAF